MVQYQRAAKAAGKRGEQQRGCVDLSQQTAGGVADQRYGGKGQHDQQSVGKGVFSVGHMGRQHPSQPPHRHDAAACPQKSVDKTCGKPR